MPYSITHLCELLDARCGLPRPAAAPHLPSYHAAMALLGLCGEALALSAAGLLSALLWWKAARWLAISPEFELFCHLMALTAILVALAEAALLARPWYRIEQRSTYGTARWADPALLCDLRLARRQPNRERRMTLLTP